MIIITVEGGFVQEVYSDNPGEIVLVRDWDSSEDGERPGHSAEEALDLKACDPNEWPDVDMEYYRNIESGTGVYRQEVEDNG